MSPRIDIEAVIDEYVLDLAPEDRDDLMAILYCWRDEAVSAALHGGA